MRRRWWMVQGVQAIRHAGLERAQEPIKLTQRSGRVVSAADAFLTSERAGKWDAIQRIQAESVRLRSHQHRTADESGKRSRMQSTGH